MISLIQREICDRRKWITQDELFELLAIAESTPGPIAINSATFIGYKKRNVIGSVMATLGVVLPSFIIIVLISIFLAYFNNNVYITAFLKGIQSGVCVLIFDAAFRLWSKSKINFLNVTLFVLAFYVSFFTTFNLIFLLIIIATFAIIISLHNAIMVKLNA